MANKSAQHLLNLKDEIVQFNTINAAHYQRYDVKRGLRNKDGSGVLAGLSQISSVVGSQIIDGDRLPVEGILKYRGVPLDELMQQFSQSDRFCFEKVMFLLLVGRLPSQDEEVSFIQHIHQAKAIPDVVMNHIIQGIPSKNIMNKCQLALASLYHLDDDADSLDPYQNFLKSVDIIAKLPTIIAMSYLIAYRPGAKLLEPPKDCSLAEGFLYVLNEGKKGSELENFMVDLSLILHAEHGGGNNSTFTTAVVTSSGSDIYSTLAAAIAS